MSDASAPRINAAMLDEALRQRNVLGFDLVNALGVIAELQEALAAEQKKSAELEAKLKKREPSAKA